MASLRDSAGELTFGEFTSELCDKLDKPCVVRVGRAAIASDSFVFVIIYTLVVQPSCSALVVERMRLWCETLASPCSGRSVRYLCMRSK